MLLNLAYEHTQLGLEPVIASIRNFIEEDLTLEEEATNRSLKAFTIRMHDGPNMLGAWKLLRIAKKRGFDILHSHGYKGNILLGFIPRTIRTIPLVSTLHGWTSTSRLSKMFLYEFLDSLSMKNIDAVCTVNSYMLSHRRLRHMKERLYVVPNGIPSLIESKDKPEEEIVEFCKQGFTIATIGRLSKEKGHELLIKAFSDFQNVFADARLLILGEGPERGKLEGLVNSKNLYGKVMLPGYKEQAWKYLKNCKIFVLSSVTEGMPITLLEAMQTGIPVIATAVGGIPEIITNEDLGYLAQPGSPENLCERMIEVRNDMTGAEIKSKKAKEITHTRFSVKAMAENYLNIYNKLLRQ